MPKTDVVELFLVKLKITRHSIAMKREYQHLSKYVLMALVVIIFLYLMYGFFDNSISKQIYNCSRSNARRERYRISKEKRKEAEPIMKCLRDNGLDPRLQGSVSTNMAHKGSDIDLEISNQTWNLGENTQTGHILSKCGFKKNKNFTKTATTNTNLGPYLLYNGETNKGTHVDLLVKPVKQGGWRDDVVYDKEDEEVRDILYCVNRHINSRNAKSSGLIRRTLNRFIYRGRDDTRLEQWPSSVVSSRLQLFGIVRQHRT